MNHYERFCYAYNLWIAATRDVNWNFDLIQKKWADYCLARDLFHGHVKLPDEMIKAAFKDSDHSEVHA